MHIFYKTFKDFEFSGETLEGKEKKKAKTSLELKWSLNHSSLIVLTSGQYWGFQLNTPFFLEATLLGM